MSGELLRIVDAIHRDKNIDTEIIFNGIESAYLTAARRHFGEEIELTVNVDRATGEITATAGGEHIDALTLGRIAAQTAKQIMIQKIREAERDSLYDEFIAERGTVVVGTAQRNEGSVVTVNIGKTEAILPRSEQMPGEIYSPAERIRALILEVRKSGQRLKIVLSRAHPDFVRRLFEQEVPEIAEHIIEIRGIAREAGFRTKVAVSSIDSKVDCVGACVGVRGSRIKNITDELGGEKVEIIRYNESMQVMIPNALAPAEIEEVQIYPRMGRAIVLVREDQLSLAIGKRGQNVRLASKLVGIDIEIMTFDELTEEIDNAESNLSTIPGLSETMVDALIEEGYFSFDDLSVIEPDDLMELTSMTDEQCSEVIAYAEQQAEAAAGETSSRSSILSSPASSRPSAGASSERKRPGVPTIDELLGAVEPEVKETKLTMDQLFSDAPAASTSDEPAASESSGPSDEAETPPEEEVSSAAEESTDESGEG
jgi:N utilization substance protein A